MEKLVFDDGIKEFEINGDPSRVLRFNPTDIGFVERYNDCLKTLETELKALDDVNLSDSGEPIEQLKETAELVKQVRMTLTKMTDHVFYEGASELIFGNINPLALSGGKTIFENFFSAIDKVVRPYMIQEQKKHEKNINKYKAVYKNL